MWYLILGTQAIALWGMWSIDMASFVCLLMGIITIDLILHKIDKDDHEGGTRV